MDVIRIVQWVIIKNWLHDTCGDFNFIDALVLKQR